MKRHLLTYIILGTFSLIPGTRAGAQEKKVLTPEVFIQHVHLYHPMAKQADLLKEQATAGSIKARGGFDPVFEMNANEKTLDGINYYQYSKPELKIPTAVGIEVKTGVENSSGQFRNPELTNGVASYVGLEVPLLNGLLMDKRRAALQQAKIYMRQSEQERRVMINDLLLNAYMSYWEWAGAYQLYRTYTNYLEVAGKRTRLVNISFQNGDRSAADTVEAFAQLQNYLLLQSDARMQLNNKVLDMSEYLWTAGGEPYMLHPNHSPDTTWFIASFPLPDTNDFANGIVMNHPMLKTQQYKLQSLEVERKLKFQNLLPVVNLRANLLSKDYFNYNHISAYYLENNYKLGVNMKVPLFFRQGRGEYKGIKIKIKEANLELAQKSWHLQTKFRKYYNEAARLREQIQIASAMLQNYRSLLKMEELKFSQGESSLFLINSREIKTLEMEQKIIELQAKYMKAVYSARWAGGFIDTLHLH